MESAIFCLIQKQVQSDLCKNIFYLTYQEVSIYLKCYKSHLLIKFLKYGKKWMFQKMFAIESPTFSSLIKEYLNKIRPYLKYIINNLKKSYTLLKYGKKWMFQKTFAIESPTFSSDWKSDINYFTQKCFFGEKLLERCYFFEKLHTSFIVKTSENMVKNDVFKSLFDGECKLFSIIQSCLVHF